MNFIVNAKVVEEALPPEILDLLGPPDAIRVVRDQATAFSWTVDEAGDGIAVARSATRSGLEGQMRALLALARRGRRVRELVVAPSTCGNRGSHERPDLLEIIDAIEGGWCRFVAFVRADRISRVAEAQALFAEYLLETGVDLVLAQEGAEAVDLEELSIISQLMSLPGAPKERRRRRPAGNGPSDKR